MLLINAPTQVRAGDNFTFGFRLSNFGPSFATAPYINSTFPIAFDTTHSSCIGEICDIFMARCTQIADQCNIRNVSCQTCGNTFPNFDISVGDSAFGNVTMGSYGDARGRQPLSAQANAQEGRTALETVQILFFGEVDLSVEITTLTPSAYSQGQLSFCIFIIYVHKRELFYSFDTLSNINEQCGTFNLAKCLP